MGDCYKDPTLCFGIRGRAIKVLITFRIIVWRLSDGFVILKEEFKINYMKNKNFIICLAIILLVIIVICTLPYLFTNYSVLDFTDTGEIGDTIGGIMGPFVGILAAVLTFMAFWIQYKANEAQRDSINDNKVEIKKQQHRYEIGRFENQWLSYLEIYKETVQTLQYANITGKRVFKELLEELALIYELVEYGYAQWIANQFKHGTPEHQESVNSFITILLNDDKALREFFTETAYTLFFYGKPYFSIELTINNPGKVIAMEQIYKFVSKIPSSISEKVKKSFVNRMSIGSVHHYQYYAPQSVLIGESYQLGQYFRVLYSLVNFIDKTKIEGIQHKEKYEYLKLLRCQMSDEEQALLYYNSISPMGSEWNTIKSNENISMESMGLIAKYRLLKNLPPRFNFFGINPMEYYTNEIKFYEEKNIEFFEHESFYKYSPKVYVDKNVNGTHNVINLFK